jgi:hypothetical protein
MNTLLRNTQQEDAKQAFDKPHYFAYIIFYNEGCNKKAL